MNAARRALVVLFVAAAATGGCSLVMNPGKIRDEAALADGGGNATGDGATDATNADGAAADAGSDANLTVDGATKVPIFFEDFEALTVRSNWTDGTSEGSWACDYAGGGSAGVEIDGTKTFFLLPRLPDGGTQSALVSTTRDDFGDVEFVVRVKTVAQLSTTPDPDQAATIVWREAVGSTDAYYVTVGPSQWDFGTTTATGITSHDIAGPGCPINQWCKLHVRDVAGSVSVSIDDRPARTVSAPKKLGPGRIGLYADSAHARFDDLAVYAP